ncbi:MAG: aminotransferase class III-fold pyridoxal phosphate-dependent enzyme [Saprospiraceae bacterium]|nr:aminotransferase class III-fold pyridoxal phosphate-dependent enzyme [Saprospiraceae bacterium]
MQTINYQNLSITEKQAEALCQTHYGIVGKARKQTGEIDFNFKITTKKKEQYILKISRPNTEGANFDFQQQLLLHIESKNPDFPFPKIIKTQSGETDTVFTDAHQQVRKMRLLSWVEGRLWSSVNPQLDDLRHSLGQQCGAITQTLNDFTHPAAWRKFDWDIAQAAWTYEHLHLFNKEQRACLSFFIKRFEDCQKDYKKLRKSVIHNDANDNNIVVSADRVNPSVLAVIDYGDAVYSQTINDVAVALAYAIMDKPDPLAAALPLVAGYHERFPLLEAELAMLYTLVAMRLTISVTKSAINKIQEPDNAYLLISEKPAWQLLHQWQNIPPQYAHYAFRAACGFTPVPHQIAFEEWAAEQHLTLHDLLPKSTFTEVYPMDLSIGSLFLGNYSEYQNTAVFTQKVNQLQAEQPHKLLAGGYREARPLYATKAYEIEGNEGPEYRTIHLGVDFWAKEGTPIHALFDGEVVGCGYTKKDKDYGGVIILKHKMGKKQHFYTLYGHLSKKSAKSVRIGDTIKKGKKIGSLGDPSENGNWTPHLHFQIMLDLLGYENDFPGVALPSKLDIWASISPDPNTLFKDKNLKPYTIPDHEAMLAFRRQHLGKSLSISYKKPLRILRGERQYLLDDTGRRYLDTVNNVPHVGHEHPAVVAAGQRQMAVLNTNTRYLHENILDFARALLKTLPPQLSVLHFVNSGSEANELALRMAQAATQQKDVIALEVGYHGNTQGCIAVSSYKFDGKGGKGKPEHTHIVPLPDSFRGKYQGDKSETGALYAAHVTEAIADIAAKGRGVAAFLAESIVSCGGQIDLPDHYLSLAYEAVRKAGGVCIADEVQVGFGRVGKKFWGFELHNVVPDIVTMGKPIGNGHPLAAVACTEAVALAFANGMEYFNTFGGNPVSAAIGSAVLTVIHDEKLQENALEIGEFLKTELRELQKDYPLIGDVRGEGLFLGFELVEQGKIPATDKTAYLANRMKAHGILLSVDGPQNNVIKIKPPLCFSRENAVDMLRYLRKIFAEDFMK